MEGGRNKPTCQSEFIEDLKKKIYHSLFIFTFTKKISDDEKISRNFCF